jgi:hypothetical protein
MRGRRGRHIAAGSVLAACVCAASAIASLQHTLKFTTGSFVVNCTSTGQLCSPAEKLTFKLAHAATLTSVTYSTAATHCSTVQLHVYLKGHQIAKTGVLPAGAATEKLTTHVALPRGKTTLAFKAQGFLGGCNAGRVLSWGGTVTVTVKSR